MSNAFLVLRLEESDGSCTYAVSVPVDDGDLKGTIQRRRGLERTCEAFVAWARAT